MRILIDTHIFLWFINSDPQLSLTAKTLLESDVELLLSVASLWEIAVKVSTGKMTSPKPFEVLSLNSFSKMRLPFYRSQLSI